MRCGQRIRSGVFRERLDRVFEGQPQFVRPYPTKRNCRCAALMARCDRWRGSSRRSASATVRRWPRSRWASRPIANSKRSSRPHGRANTGEAYAFGDDGLMLTSSRLAESPDGGRADAQSDVDCRRSPAIHVRDPGGERVGGNAPKLEPAARPLTQAAALAIAARDKTAEIDRRGVIATPYRGYRGTEVIGAWRLAAGLRLRRGRGDFRRRGLRDAALPDDQPRRSSAASSR